MNNYLLHWRTFFQKLATICWATPNLLQNAFAFASTCTWRPFVSVELEHLLCEGMLAHARRCRAMRLLWRSLAALTWTGSRLRARATTCSSCPTTGELPPCARNCSMRFQQMQALTCLEQICNCLLPAIMCELCLNLGQRARFKKYCHRFGRRACVAKPEKHLWATH